jgi:large conductance mechanosensitive channel
MKRFGTEFKKFLTRGNVIDMAVGVIVGGAFTAIINSLVADVFTPIVNMLTGKLNFSEWVVPIGTSQLLLGNFVQAVINFLLTALILFIIMHTATRMRERREKIIAELKARKEAEEATEAPVEEAPAEPEPTKEELLLTEIRDLLAAQVKADK